MIKFDIQNRFSGAVQFTADIECKETALRSVKIGLAVLWAIKNRADLSGADLYRANLYRANLYGANLRGANLSGADLRGANLRDADLRGAYLRGAYLRGANLSWANLYRADLREADLRGTNLCGAEGISTLIIDGGIRSDGYRFLLTRTEPGPWRIKAGCRNFTLDEAQAHWTRTRPEGDALGDETRLIIAHMMAVAKLRNWPEGGEEREQENAA